jgi:hypothetical protein
MNDLLWMLLALALFPCGWFAGLRYAHRKVDALQGQVDELRKSADDAASQARRQIRQLRIELAARPPASPERAAAAVAASAIAAARPAAKASPTAGSSRAALEKQIREYDAAAAKAKRSGFADTQVMDEPELS